MAKAPNIEITNFENELEVFKNGFARNYNLASNRLEEAIEQSDRSNAAMNRRKMNFKARLRIFALLTTRLRT